MRKMWLIYGEFRLYGNGKTKSNSENVKFTVNTALTRSKPGDTCLADMHQSW